MIPNVTRGSNVGGLMVYLAGDGRHNEHAEQHLVGGDSVVMAMYGFAQLDTATALAIARDLDEPRVRLGVDVTRNVRVTDPATGIVSTAKVAADVWHCSLSLSAVEGQLSDEKWGAIAQDFTDRMGFTEAGGKAACRWVAVRHGLSANGNDHIHIAVSLVREDGTKASTHKDFKHAQEISRDLEREYGLELLESRDLGMGERGVKPGERERATRQGRAEIDAHTLERGIRASAIASVDEGEFVRRVRRAGILIRPRFAAGRDDVVAGYSVALRPARGGHPIWFGGGRLARDLTLPRLRQGWPDSPQTAQGAVDEWRATAKNPGGYRPAAPGREESMPSPDMWAEYSKEIGALRAQLRTVPVDDRAAWAHAARETAGVFAAWSQRVEATPGPLAETARQLSKTAHIRAHQSAPKPVAIGSAANAAMILLQATGGAAAEAVMLRQLGRTAVAILDMHSAVGDSRRAREIATVMRTQFAQIADRLPTPTTAPVTAPVLDASLDPVAAEAIRIAREGEVARPTGVPVPTRLTPVPARTPVVPVRGDDYGRE